MTIDIAQLGIEVHSEKIKESTSALRDLRTESNLAEQSTRKMSTSTQKLEDSFRRVAKSAADMELKTQKIIGISTGLDRVSKSAKESGDAFQAAFAKSEAQLELLKNSIDPVYAATMRYNQAIEVLDQSLRAGVITEQEHARVLLLSQKAFLGAAANVQQMGGAMGALSKLSPAAKASLQNVSYQVQDLVTQLSMGTSAFVAFGQQGPQLLGAFGPVGALLGVLTAVTLPALGIVYRSLTSESASLADQVDALYDSLSKVNDIAKVFSLQGANELIKKYGEIDASVLLLIEHQRQFTMNTAQIDAAAAARALAEEFDVLGLKLDALGPMSITVNNTLSRMGKELDLTQSQTRSLVKALQEASNASTFEEQARALGVVNTILAQSNLKTSELAGKALEAEDAMRQLSESAPGANWLGAAIDGAQTLAGSLWDAVRANSALRDQAFAKQQGPDERGSQRLQEISAGEFKRQQAADAASKLRNGGGGGGGAGTDDFQNQLDKLVDDLQTEQEVVQEWYDNSQQILEEALDLKKITQEEHDDYMERLEKEHQDRLRGIQGEGIAGTLGAASTFFADLANLSQDGNGKLMKISKAFAAAEALVNTYRAAAQTLADPTMTFWQKFAAVAKVIAAGLGLVRAIQSGGKAATPTGGSQGRGGTATAPSTASAEPKPQRVILDVPKGAMLSAEFMQEFFTRFYDLNKNKGVVFQVTT